MTTPTPGTAYRDRLLKAVPTVTAAPAATDEALYLPDSFWTARPYLQVIAAAAWAHLASPDAVLHAVLARAAAFVGPGTHIDAGLGRAPLNYFTAIIAPSGVGKSVSTGIAEKLLPAPVETVAIPAPLDGISIGSGEGMAEAYMGDVKKPPAGGRGRPTTVREQVRHCVYFEVDEGEVLTKLMHERQGSTLGVNLRTAWSGKPLGQANATAERTRRVTNYAMGLTVGFQPTALAPLFREKGLGTPQRFTYAMAKPQTVPSWEQRAEWSPTEIHPPAWGRAWHLVCDETIRRAVYEQRVARALGVTRVDPMDEHEPLMLMKLAGLLTILDQGRQRVTDEDWALARTVWDTSRQVRAWAVAQLAAEQDQQETEQAQARGRATVVIQEVVHDSKTQRIARNLVKHVTTAAEPLKLGRLQARINKRDRDYITEALILAVESQWITRIPPDDPEKDQASYIPGMVDPPALTARGSR